MSRPRPRPIEPDDIGPLREAIRSYHAWLKANGREPSPYWADRIKRALADAGITAKPRPLDSPREPGED